MRVLLINAPPHQIVERMYDTPEFTRLSLATLAGFIRPHGHQVACIDAKFERLNYDDVVARAKEFKPDLVGLTAFTNEVKPAARVAALIKKAIPDVKTILGGVHMTAIPERSMDEFGMFDFGAIGEGEQTLLDLIKALESRGDLHGVDGLIWRDSGGAVVKNKPRMDIGDQDTIPMPAGRESTVLTARGCPSLAGSA